jgi:hypothetical protein
MVAFRSMEERQAILKVDMYLRAVFLHNITTIFFHPISGLKMKSDCLSESFVSANEIKLSHNTEDQNISL